MMECADNEYGLPIKKDQSKQKNQITTIYGRDGDSPLSEFDQYGYPKAIQLRKEKIEQNVEEKE